MSEPPVALVVLAPGLRARLGEIADLIVTRIQDEFPVYRAQTFVSTDELRRTAVENVTYLLRTDALPDGDDLAAARRTGTVRGRTGAPLPELLAAFRRGFTVFWEVVADAAIASGEVGHPGPG
jgi:hypothetical protein